MQSPAWVAVSSLVPPVVGEKEEERGRAYGDDSEDTERTPSAEPDSCALGHTASKAWAEQRTQR